MDSTHKKNNYQEKLKLVDPELLKKWEQIQNEIKKSIIFEIPPNFNPKFLAGVDISFSKRFPLFAASTISILTPDLTLVGLKTIISKNDVPYVPGFLAFREVDSLKQCYEQTLEKLAKEIDNFKIDLIFVDGNGILHPRECGLACHLGVVLGVPTIGCAKTIFAIDGINKNIVDEIKKEFKQKEGEKGITVELKGKSGKIWGVAVKNSKKAYDPIIVSNGHLIDMKNALNWTVKSSKKRVVEPIRVADLHSRLIIAKFEKFYDEKTNSKVEENVILEDFQKEIDSNLDDIEFYKK